MNTAPALLIFPPLYYPQISLFLLVALKAGVLVAFGAGLALLLRSRSAAARCWVWRCTVLGVFAVLVFDFGPGMLRHIRPTVPVRVSRDHLAVVWQEMASLHIVRPPEEIRELMEARTIKEKGALTTWSTPADMRPPFWNRVEMSVRRVWWSVAAIAATFAVLRIVAGILWLKRGALAADAAMRDLCGQVARDFGLRRRIRVRLSPRLQAPLLVGVWRPLVYLPAAAASWTETKLRSVFRHEIAHARRHDNFWQYLGKLAVCLLWWHPLVAWAARRMALEAEEAADDAVLVHEQDAPAYAELLVEIAARNAGAPVPAAGFSMLGRRPLEKRIEALLRANPWRGRVGRLPAMAIVLVLVATVLGAAFRFALAADDQGGAKVDSPALTPAQGTALERVIAANRKRLAAWRYLHFALESSFTEEEAGTLISSPQPTVLEAWVDAETNIHRAEYRPRVTRWMNGAAPFYIKDTTEINDGKAVYSFDDLDELDRLQPRSLQNMDECGVREMKAMIATAAFALEASRGRRLAARYLVDEETREGKTLLRIREQFFAAGKVSQEKSLLIDPAQDDWPVVCEMRAPLSHAEPQVLWKLLGTATGADGLVRPAEYEREFDLAASKTTTRYKVAKFEPLAALPDGLTDLPKPAGDAYVAKNGRPVSHGKLTVKYINAADGKPVALVDAVVRSGRQKPGEENNRVRGLRLQSDTEGKIIIPLLEDQVDSLSVKATAAGMVPQTVKWSRYGDPLQLPESYTVKLSPSVPIAGRVVNEDGQPIAGAKVGLGITGLRRLSFGVFADYHAAGGTFETDAAGRWSYADAPETLEGMTIRVSVKGYRSISNIDFRTGTGLTYASLRDGTADIKLSRGASLTGQVLDETGNPMANARLTLGRDRWGTNLPTAESDATGHFTFTDLSPGEETSWLTIESARHQPFAVQVSVPAKAPLVFRLKPGRSLRARVVREDGSPCAGFKVGADTWNELRTLTFETQTDADGRFVWRDAPEEPVSFYFNGGRRDEFLSGLQLRAEEQEQVVVIKPALRLSARAIDRSTRKALANVRVTPGRILGPGDIYWEKDSATTRRGDAIAWKTPYISDQNRVFRLEADGYEALQTREFGTNQESYDETFVMIPRPPAR